MRPADEWVIMQMLYWDDYERIGGRWYFRRRLPCYWYATDLNRPPTGERKMRWPGREPYEGSWHELWPSWKSFWANPPAGGSRGRRARAARRVPHHHAPRRAGSEDPCPLRAPPAGGRC